MTTPTVGILEAVDTVITRARELHESIPEKLVVVLDSGKTRRGMNHGHFARESWEGNYHEIKLGTESLVRGATPTLGTILHELSHATAFEQGIADTSNKGRYHNGKFRDIGTAMGISLEKVGTIGWSQTTVPEGTQSIYEAELQILADSLITYRKGFEKGLDTKIAKPVKSRPKMVCGCNEPITVTTKWFEDVGQYAFCQNCSQNFTIKED